MQKEGKNATIKKKEGGTTAKKKEGGTTAKKNTWSGGATTKKNTGSGGATTKKNTGSGGATTKKNTGSGGATTKKKEGGTTTKENSLIDKKEYDMRRGKPSFKTNNPQVIHKYKLDEVTCNKNNLFRKNDSTTDLLVKSLDPTEYVFELTLKEDTISGFRNYRTVIDDDKRTVLIFKDKDPFTNVKKEDQFPDILILEKEIRILKTTYNEFSNKYITFGNCEANSWFSTDYVTFQFKKTQNGTAANT